MELQQATRCSCVVVAVGLCAVALAASPASPREPFEIVYQNDGIMGIAPRTMPHFPRWESVDDVTAPAYYHAEVDNYADCGVKSISWGLWSGGNSFNHPTKVGRLWCDGIPDEVMTHPIHLQIKHDLAACVAKGVDPLGEVVKRAKERGLTITAEMRANNFAPSGPIEKPSYAGPGYNGLLWYQKPEWRLTDPLPYDKKEPNCNWDWANPEVRDFNLRVLLEALHNYNVDGLDVNFAQNPPFFNHAEPNKVQHMTAFIKALRAECDRVGKERGKRVALTVLLWDRIYGRHHLSDDGLDVAAWVKAGLIDRIVVRPTGETAKYVGMVRGTKCRLYASVERGNLDHAAFAREENRYRDAGYDGVFVFNYMIGPGKIGEFRSMNVSYRGDVMPPDAANVWEQSPGGGTKLVDGALEVRGAKHFQRAAPMLTMAGLGVTVEATVQLVGASSPGTCGMEAANGPSRAALGVSGDHLILLEGDRKLEAVRIDSSKEHTLRLTIDGEHVARAYLDGEDQPVMTATLKRSANETVVRWGNLRASDKSRMHSRWRSVHYALEGAFGPGQRRFE